MVLPELSRTMAYTARNTVNRLARNELRSAHTMGLVPATSPIVCADL